MPASNRSLLSRFFNAVLPRPTPFREQGTSGVEVFGGLILSREKSPKWVGQNKYVTIQEIVSNISIVAAGVHHFLNLIAHPQWSVKPSDEDDAEAVEIAEFMEDVINDMKTPWSRIVRRAGMYRFHGFGIQEWIAKKRDDGRIGLLDIEPRPQHTIERWEIDEDGSVLGMWQRSPQTNELLGLNRKKLLYLVEDTLSDSPEGMGIFRHLAEPYERLKQFLTLETIAFERDLRGIPIGRAPLTKLREMEAAGTLTTQEANTLRNAMVSFLTAEVKKPDTAIMLDSQPYESQAADGMKIAGQPQWDLELLQGSASGMAELDRAIDRIQREMARIIGTEHLMMGDAGGNRALAVDKSRNLYLIGNSVLSNIASGVDSDIVVPVMELNNLPMEKKPKMTVEDVAFKDAAEVTSALREMATAGATLAPDDEAINDVRDLLGISRAPEPDPELLGAMQRMAAGLPPEIEGEQPGGPLPSTGSQAKETFEEPDASEDKVVPFPKKFFQGHSLAKYDPNQDRDERGRWSDQGGGSAGGGERAARAIKGAAKKTLDFLKANKRTLTAAATATVFAAVNSTLSSIAAGDIATGDMMHAMVSDFAEHHQVAFDQARNEIIKGVEAMITLRKQVLGKADEDEDPVLSLLLHILELLEGMDVEKYDPNQERDERGRWTDMGGGQSGTRDGLVGYSAGAYVDQNGKLHTTRVKDALRALAENRDVILDQPKDVSTLLNRLRSIADDAKAKGEKAPNYDLCRVSVAGSNLFCAESKGIPRAEMPQLGGEPVPGSAADQLPKNKNGEVDAGPYFKDWLVEKGYDVSSDTERANYLKASQRELNGVKVAGMVGAVEAGKLDLTKDPLFISKDNYIVDGHHRWAAAVGVGYGRSRDFLKMPVIRVDTDIITLLRAANDFTREWGVKQKGFNKRLRKILTALAVEDGQDEGVVGIDVRFV